MFLPSMDTPTVWTLRHVVPQHTEQLFQIYHQGLGTVTEEKHIVLKKLSENSSSKNQWFDIFQHEFVMLIWLPENGFTTCQYKASKGVYIPKRDNSCSGVTLCVTLCVTCYVNNMHARCPYLSLIHI